MDTKLNVWYDYGLGEGGNLIDLGIRLYNCSVEQLLERLASTNPTLPFRLQSTVTETPKSEEDNRVKIEHVQNLSHKELLAYLYARRIDLESARNYCKQVRFSINGRSWLAVGFANRSGGWELRNSWFKGASSPKDLTLIGNNSDTICVLEGFVDFLSLLTLKNQPAPCDFLILNSVALVKRGVDELQGYRQVFGFLNHDLAGQNAVAQLQAAGIGLIDCSQFYSAHNDINDYLKTQPFSQQQ